MSACYNFYIHSLSVVILSCITLKDALVINFDLLNITINLLILRWSGYLFMFRERRYVSGYFYQRKAGGEIVLSPSVPMILLKSFEFQVDESRNLMLYN